MTVIDMDNNLRNSLSRGNSTETPNMIEELESIYSTRLIYEGSKAFWRQRCTLDLFVALHCYENYGDDIVSEVIEVIGYHPGKDIETSRLYLDASKVYSLVGSKELQADVDKKRESAMRYDRSFHPATAEKEVKEQYAVNYVLARINIHQMATSPSSTTQIDDISDLKGNTIELRLNPVYSDHIDELTGQLPTVLSLRGLLTPFSPYNIPHSRIVPLEEIKRAISELNREQRKFNEEVQRVEESVEVVEQQLRPETDLSEKLTSPKKLFRSNSFLRRSVDDSHVMENTRSLAVEAEPSPAVERESLGGLVRHSSHSHGLRLVSWDREVEVVQEEESEEDDSLEHNIHHVSSPGKRKKKMKKRKKAALPAHSSPYAPRAHHLPKLNNGPRRCSSPSPMTSASSPFLFSPEKKTQLLPIDQGKPHYARSTITSRRFSAIH